MPIGPKGLLKLVGERKLVENLSKRELTNPEGAGFDLRLGKVFKINGRGFLNIEDRKTPEPNEVATYKKGKSEKFKFKPGDYYLVRTVESVNLPDDIVAYAYMRSTLHRSGLVLFSNQVNPGYKGPLTFGFANLGPAVMEIELGARFCHIQFERVEGGGSAYRGQWQGGRVAAIKVEKQV
jgi:deoxycytidine triphosphate deaminase